jgi:hypothetical protein
VFQISRNPQTRKRRPGPSEDERHLRPQLPAGPISRPHDVIVPISRLIGSLPNPTGTFPRLRHWSESRRLQVNLAV